MNNPNLIVAFTCVLITSMNSNVTAMEKANNEGIQQVTRYQLMYNNHHIAAVAQEDSDFPTFFGRYRLVDGIRSNQQLNHVVSYIDYSVRVWPLIIEDRLDEIDTGEEAKYEDLINSSNWWLVDDEGIRTAILIPVFCTNNEINWRLDTAQ